MIPAPADIGIIDLRSDTVTRPDAAMVAALAAAPLGDDVFGDDPTVILLEERAAAILGKEAALFIPSGTMGNSIALAVHCRPGDEAVMERSSHSFNFECGGAARLWGIQVLPIEGSDGRIPLEAIQASVRPRDVHMPRTRLVVLEQTHNLSGGSVLPVGYIQDAGALCRRAGLLLHLDGARIFNAAVALGCSAAEIAAPADSVMFCISKGLGAPAGSLLCGSGDFIAEARRVRKLLGGGMRQAGILAACGLHALEHNIDRLAEDHANARALGEALAFFPGLRVRPWPVATNMVYLDLPGTRPEAPGLILEALRSQGILALRVGASLRFVFHKDAAGDKARRAIPEILRSLSKVFPG